MVKKSKKYKWLLNFLSTKIPFVSSFLILILSFVKYGFDDSKAMLVLIPIFIWAMLKVKSFDFISVLLFGFIQDFMDGTPFGLNIFIFLLLYFIVYYQKIFPIESSFIFSYLSFATLTFLLLTIKYFFIYFLFTNQLNFVNTIISWTILTLFYPIFYVMIKYLYERFVGKYQ